MTAVKKPSSIAGLRRGIGTAQPHAPVEIRNGTSDLAAVATPPRPEKPVRMTLDLSPAAHRMLRDFAAQSGVGVSAAKVLRALLTELGDDPELATRVRARIWDGRA